GEFAQLCHGKAPPLRAMARGDWLLYYSPKTDMDGGQPLQQFTAIGRVVGDEVYRRRMTARFVPFRRDVRYMECRPAAIAPLIPKLSFIKDPRRWGFPFRRGYLEIGESDFHRIARAMGAACE